MELLNEIYIPEFESQIYKSPLDDKYYTKIEHITDNIFFPLNIICEQGIKKCAILIIINTGYIVESINMKFENYIKLIFELLFEYKNNFNKLFNKYNLKYKNKIYPEKIIIYLEFDYLGLNPIFSSFIKNLIFFDKLIIQNNISDILNSINIANDINTSYLTYKKFFQKNSETNEIDNNSKNKEINLLEFFQYYFLKNKDKYLTILSPYPNDQCKNIITNIFDKLKKDIKNNIFKTYEKSTPLSIKFLPFDDPSILLVRKIDVKKNNILKLKFYFPSLTYEKENILEYIVYMINGKRIGSLYYHLLKNQFILDLKACAKYNYNMPPQIIIKMKLYSNITQFSLKIIISKLMNFLKKLKSDIKNIKVTYENFQKMLLLNFNNNNDLNYYYFLYEFTNNFISLRKNPNNQNDSNKYLNLLINRYLLPEYNSSLIINILDEIISLNNLVITLELYPKLYSNFSYSLKSYNTTILNTSIESNVFNTYIYGIINKQEILKYSFTTTQYDNSSFKHKQDKKIYISKESISNINNNKILLNNNSKIQLGLNTIANKLWYYISDGDDINNSNMVFSKFHIIHPNIRNHTNNIYNINIKYYNYIDKKIEQEFEEIFEMGNEIKLTRDDNGFNLEIKAFKGIYIKILEKIFSFFFEFENDFIEYGDVNYTTEYFKSDFDKAIKCLHTALKNDINEKYFEAKNKMMNLFILKLYGMNLEDNLYIDGFIYGNLDLDIIKIIKNVLLEYNTREYDNNSIFENTTEFKKKVLETKKINEGNIYIYKLTGDFREHFINYFISFYQILDFDKEKKIFLLLIYLLFKKHLNNNTCKVYKIFIDEIYYILILRKSFDYPEYMAKNISLNIKKLIDICNNKSDKDLIQILLDLKSQFSEEILNQKFKYDFFWSEIYNNTYNFDFEIKDKKSYVEYIEHKIDLNEFKNYFKNNFFFKQRKIEFLYYQGSIKYFNNNINKNKESYPWNLDFINDNGFIVHEIYYNINKIN